MQALHHPAPPSTEAPPAEGWRVPPSHVYTRHEDGRWFAYDPGARRIWSLPEATVDLLAAIRDGWQPGAPVPEALARHLDEGEDWAEVLVALEAEGLVAPGPRQDRHPAEREPRLARLGWSDIRLRLLTLRSPGPGTGRTSRWALWSVPLLAPAVVAGALAMHLRGMRSEVFLAWTTFSSAAPSWKIAMVQLTAFLLMLVVHECGHAWFLAASTGRPAPLGVRLYYGVPQGYSEVSALITLPDRRRRLMVLLGGVIAEALAWLLLLPWAAAGNAPPVVTAMVLYSGPLVVMFNLVPLVRNDGYYVLQELTGIQDLMSRAEAATRSFFRGGEVESAGPAWLPWYGLAHVHFLAASGILVGTWIGGWVSLPTAGALGGLGGAAAYLVITYSRAARLEER